MNFFTKKDGTQIEITPYSTLTLCRDHWRLISRSEELPGQKVKDSALESLCFSYSSMLSSCFCCKAAQETYGFQEPNCQTCALGPYWTKGPVSRDYRPCMSPDSYYFKWIRSKSLDEASLYASEIVSLCTKALIDLS
jgi:hypothetical protein